MGDYDSIADDLVFLLKALIPFALIGLVATGAGVFLGVCWLLNHLQFK